MVNYTKFFSKKYNECVVTNINDLDQIDNLILLEVVRGYGELDYPLTLIFQEDVKVHFYDFNEKIVADHITLKLNSLNDLEISREKEVKKVITPESNGAIKSDGGSSTYYDIEIPKWLLGVINKREEEGGAYVKTEELIEVGFGNDFNFGTLFKSTVRAYGCSVGAGKAGNDMGYEVNKVKYYSDKIYHRYSRSKGEGDF